MREPEFWSRHDWTARLAVAALSPLGWAYGAATDWKRRNTRALRPRARVICVGNLTAGGSGKTPVVQALARRLRKRGVNVIVLSRGYGGRLRKATLVDPQKHGAADVGDEPLLLAAVAPVIVARDRREGAALADAHGADVILMDDGHQNFRLAKDLSVVVVDAEQGFGNGRILPTGPLREPVRNGLARAELVVLVGDGTPLLPGYEGPVVRARLAPVDDLGLAGRKVVAFAGIGRPEKFFDTLRSLNAELADARTFADHHVFSAGEIARLKSKARSEGAMLVTTEKDFVRLTSAEKEGVIPFPVEARFESSEELDAALTKAASREGTAGA